MRRFWTDRKGNVAILFALAVVPLVGAMGAAVDYSMASAYRTDMQKALDATALALAKMMPANKPKLEQTGLQFFQANLGKHSLSNLQLTVTPGANVLRVSATGYYTPHMVRVIGIDVFEVSVFAEVRWGIGKVEVALALDNTGSMSRNNKLTELKRATHNLLDVLQSAARNPDDAKVAIIPFDTMVNVGTENVNASWIRWTEWEEENQDCSGKDRSRTCFPRDRSRWNGCVMDRDKDPNVNYDVLDTVPNNPSTRYPAKQCPGSLVAMMPLTNDWAALHKKVDSMSAAGYTNVTIGVVWGWHALSHTPVLTEGAPPATKDLTKYIILLTDGDNTQNRWTKNQAQIDARTALACANAKAAGIKLYAIRVIEGNANLLRNCASDPSMYYDVKDASQLIGVFNSIGGQIASLHLSR